MNSRYLVKNPLGRGGVGAVYLATDQQLQRDVAIKRLHLEGEEGEEATEALMKEATTLSALNHPNIVTVHDIGTDEEGPYVVMEYVQGETFEDLVKRGALTWADFQQVAIQTLEGLIAAQHHGLVHRDIKPGNLMLTWRPSGSFDIKLLDFGLAKFSPKPSKQTVDQGDAIMGSIYFMAPEQFERRELDARTDLYSLGGVFYYGLTGHYPFDGDTAAEVMASHLMNRFERLDSLRPDVPVWARAWVHWLLRRNMEDRPADAAAALQAFIRQGEGVPVDTSTAAVRPVPPRPTRGTGAITSRVGSASGVPRAGQPTSRPGTATAAHPVTASASARPKKVGLWLGIGGGALALVVALIVILGRGKGDPKRLAELLNEGRGPSSVLVGEESDFRLLYPLLQSGRADGSDGAAAAAALAKLSWGGTNEQVLVQLSKETNDNALSSLMFIASERQIPDLLPALVANLARYQGNAKMSALSVIRQSLEKGGEMDAAEFNALLNEIDRADPAVRQELGDLLMVAVAQADNPATMVQSLIGAAGNQTVNPVVGSIVRRALAGSGRPEAIEFLIGEVRQGNPTVRDMALKALGEAPDGTAAPALTAYAVQKLDALRGQTGTGSALGLLSEAQSALGAAVAQLGKLEGPGARAPLEQLVAAIERADLMSTLLRDGLGKRSEAWAEELAEGIKTKFPGLGPVADNAIRDIRNRRSGGGADA